MTPDEYQTLQEEFLRLRSLDESQREEELSRLSRETPDAVEMIRALLKADSIDDDFLNMENSKVTQNDGIGLLSNPGSFSDTDGRDSIVTNGQSNEAETNHSETTGFESNDRQVLPESIGPYRVLQQIGEGGHGDVFMAEQREPIRRKVAIKWIKSGMESKMILARFEAERQALAMMSHPSIANVIDAGNTDTGRPYFVMELVHGVPIDEFCNENQLDVRERLALFCQVCDAVHHAHRKGIIHRDIKPANVMVTVDSGKPLAKVIDFGIAKAMHLSLTDKTMFTEFGQIVGTLEYMSPEQATMSQADADVRSDVYSLGALLYLLLTGETPISKSELLKNGIWELRNVLMGHRTPTPSLRLTGENSPQRWRDRADAKPDRYGDVRGDLDWITMKALAKEPDQRYDSAAELNKEIQCFLNGEPVSARPPSLLYTLRKFLQRHQVASVVTSAVVLTVLISLGAVSWGLYRSQENLTEAKAARELVSEKAKLLTTALNETDAERQRADSSARRMAKMLERNILETAWRQSLDGDSANAKEKLSDVADADRKFEWQFVNSISQQMDWPSLRSETSGAIRQMAVHPKLGLLAIITTDSLLEIWDVAKRKLSKTIELDKAIYNAVAFSNDGSTLLIGRAGDAIQFVDLAAATKSKLITHGLGGTRGAVHDSRNQKWMITTGANYLCVIDQGLLELEQKTKLPTRVSMPRLSPDGDYIIIPSLDGECFVVGSNSTDRFSRIGGSSSPIAAVRWLKDQTLSVANQDGERFSISNSILLDLISSNAITEPTRFTPIRSNQISISKLDAVTILDDGDLIWGDKNGNVNLDNLAAKRTVPLRKFSPAINQVTLLDRPSVLLVTHFNGRVNLISQEDIICRKKYVGEYDNMTDGVALGSRNMSITGHRDGWVKVWDTQTGNLIRQNKTHTTEIFSLQVHEPMGLVATMAADWKVKIADIENLQTRFTIPVGLGVRPVQFSNDGKWLACGPDKQNTTDLFEGTVDLWNTKTGTMVKRLAGHSNWVTQIQFFESDAKLATLSLDGTLKIWSTKSGRCESTIDLSELASASQFQIHEEKKKVTFAHADGSLSLFDLTTNEMIKTAHHFGSPVGGILLPRRADCLVVSVLDEPYLYCVNFDSLQMTAKLDAGNGSIAGIRTDMKSRRLQILGDNGAVRIWELPINQQNESDR